MVLGHNTLTSVFFFHVCVCAHLCAGTHVHVCTCMWRLEDNIRWCSTLGFWDGACHWDLELTDSASLPVSASSDLGFQAREVSLAVLRQSWGSDSDPGAHKARALPVGLSLRPPKHPFSIKESTNVKPEQKGIIFNRTHFKHFSYYSTSPLTKSQWELSKVLPSLLLLYLLSTTLPKFTKENAGIERTQPVMWPKRKTRLKPRLPSSQVA